MLAEIKAYSPYEKNEYVKDWCEGKKIKGFIQS